MQRCSSSSGSRSSSPSTSWWDRSPGRLDLTQNKIYSLSPETYKLLDGLKTDVTITTIGKPGGEDATIHEILLKYAARNRHVKLQTIDPELNPGWTKKYDPTGQGLAAGTLIVATPTKYKNIGLYDMYNYDTSNYDPSNPNSQPQLTSLSVEQRVTSALLFVTAARNTTIAVLEGHGEQTLDAFGLSSSINNENYAVQTLSFLSAPAVPAGTDILLILAPKTDLTSADADKVRAYLARRRPGCDRPGLPGKGQRAPEPRRRAADLRGGGAQRRGRRR